MGKLLIPTVEARMRHLLAEEWYDRGGASVPNPAGCCAHAAMVDDRSHPLKEPFVRAIIDIEHTAVINVCRSKFAPATRDDCSTPCYLNSFKD